MRHRKENPKVQNKQFMAKASLDEVVDNLKKAISSDEVVATFLPVYLSAKRSRKETDFSQASYRVTNDGLCSDLETVVYMVDALEKSGAGSAQADRNGKKTRFRWSYAMGVIAQRLGFLPSKDVSVDSLSSAPASKAESGTSNLTRRRRIGANLNATTPLINQGSHSLSIIIQGVGEAHLSYPVELSLNDTHGVIRIIQDHMIKHVSMPQTVGAASLATAD